MPAARDPGPGGGPSLPQVVPPGRTLPSLGFPANRRDGARLLSVVLMLAVACLVRLDHPVGRVLALLTSSLALYWGVLYRRLEP